MNDERIEVVFVEFVSDSGHGRVIAREDDGGDWEVIVQAWRSGGWYDHGSFGYAKNIGVELPASIQITKS